MSFWLLLTIASAALLGFYDYFKKTALRDNAVLPVLFCSTATSALVWLPFAVWSFAAPDTLPHEFFHVTDLTGREHLMLLIKSVIVGASWLCGYFGIKSLPLSIAAPIRATSPLWTILFAVMLFGESPSGKQWTGVAVILLSFFAMTFVGRKEGIHFHRDKAVFFIIGATLLGSTSALYDKFLLQDTDLGPNEVQAWFSIYTCLVLTPALFLWFLNKNRHKFHWHWAIPVIGITLLAADILYFSAIAQPDALISLISPARRTSVIVSFLLGIFLFREKQLIAKAACVAAIIVGALLLS